MPLKKIYLYDLVNDPLRVKGIRVELYDAIKRRLIDHDISRDLNPTVNNLPSDTWGVELNFPSGRNPLDILISDTTYTYPGNSLRYLNGHLNDDVYMDLFQLPSGPGGGDLPSIATPPEINAWIERSPYWDYNEKDAVRGLVFNYAAIIGPASTALAQNPDLTHVAKNWEEAARHVGIPEEILSPSSSLGRAQVRGGLRTATAGG